MVYPFALLNTVTDIGGLVVAVAMLVLAVFTPIVNTLFKAHTEELMRRNYETFITKVDVQREFDRVDGRIDKMEERKV